MTQGLPIIFRPVPVNGAEAQACIAAYADELSQRFGTRFATAPEPAPEVYEPPLGVFLLAERDGMVLGCVGLKGDGPASAEIKRLWGAPAARGTGLGRRLMEAVEQAARDLGIARLRLDTSRHLPEAKALYERTGWSAVPRYNDNPHADFWFEKRL